MIKITYGSREPPSLVIRGHAGYKTIGEDIVCAGVSTLFLTLMNSLAEYTEDLVSVRCEPGDSSIIWRGSITEQGLLLVNSCLLGLRGISELYPEYVELNIV